MEVQKPASRARSGLVPLRPLDDAHFRGFFLESIWKLR